MTDHKNLQRYLRGGGKQGRGKPIDLVSLATTSYKFRQAFDEIKYLNQWLAKLLVFNYENLIDEEVSFIQNAR